MEWKDETSYSKGDKERIPTIWVARIGELRVAVHRHIHHDPDVWLLSCDPWFRCRELPVKEVVLAQKFSLELIRDELDRAIKALNK